MFYYLDGEVTVIERSLAVIDCAGVGYACFCSAQTLSRLQTGKRYRLFTHFYIREDAFELFGFHDTGELQFFRRLIGVSGVGPKAALSILSAAPCEQLALAIVTGDEKMITQAQGIGKKLAQRVILELKDKLAKEQLTTGANAPSVSAGGGARSSVSEAYSALMVMGLSSSEAATALAGLDDHASVEELIRAALKRLGG